MLRNEGSLGKQKFSGELAHTEDHPPLFVTYPVKAGTPDMPPGMLLALEADGSVAPYTGTGTIAGVNNEPYTAGDAHCACLAHGTAKERMLVKAGGAALAAADTQNLRKAGVFPV